ARLSAQPVLAACLVESPQRDRQGTCVGGARILGPYLGDDRRAPPECELDPAHGVDDALRTVDVLEAHRDALDEVLGVCELVRDLLVDSLVEPERQLELAAD